MKSNSFFAKSSYLPFGLKKDAEVEQNAYGLKTIIKINSMGYRDVEFDPEKRPGCYRILCLGDSFTFGSGVDMMDTYPKVLEKILKKDFPDREIEVINAGFASADSTDSAYLYLKQEGLKLNPDLIVLGFLPRGDIDEILQRDPQRSKYDENGLPLKLRTRSFNEYFNPKRQPPSSLRYRITSKAREMFPWWDTFLNRMDMMFPILRRRASMGKDWLPGMSRVFQLEPYPEDIERTWAYWEKLVVATQNLCRENDARFLLTVLPVNFQCAEYYWKELGCKFNRGIFEVARPQNIAREAAERNGVDFLDLLPGFKRREERLFFPIDGHLNKEGNALAATILSGYIANTYLREAVQA